MAKNFQEMISDFDDFHPCSIPRGMKPYAFETELTADQQHQLNYHKLQVLRGNHQYLKSHPEIKRIVNALLHEVLKNRPSLDVDQFMANFFLTNLEMFRNIVFGDKVLEEERMEAVPLTHLEESWFALKEYQDKYSHVSTSSETSSNLSLEEPFEGISYQVITESIVIEEGKRVCENILSNILDMVCGVPTNTLYSRYGVKGKSLLFGQKVNNLDLAVSNIEGEYL